MKMPPPESRNKCPNCGSPSRIQDPIRVTWTCGSWGDVNELCETGDNQVTMTDLCDRLFLQRVMLRAFKITDDILKLPRNPDGSIRRVPVDVVANIEALHEKIIRD